jgi:raffinose/stachyose/melibiose transport system permease protein
MLIPFHSIMISLVRIARVTNLQGSLVGLGIIYIGLGVPMAIFLYTGFIRSIPIELDEAARIDGCSDLRLFFSIIFPQLKPITVTIIITNALWMWNDFLLPLLMLPNSKNYTLLLSTNMLFGQYGNNDWPAILSVLIMAMLPAVVFYMILQKSILKGISEGALKQ